MKELTWKNTYFHFRCLCYQNKKKQNKKKEKKQYLKYVNYDCMLGTKNSQWSWPSPGTACQEMLHDLHSWSYLKLNRMWPWASWYKLSLLLKKQQELNKGDLCNSLPNWMILYFRAWHMTAKYCLQSLSVFRS